MSRCSDLHGKGSCQSPLSAGLVFGRSAAGSTCLHDSPQSYSPIELCLILASWIVLQLWKLSHQQSQDQEQPRVMKFHCHARTCSNSSWLNKVDFPHFRNRILWPPISLLFVWEARSKLAPLASSLYTWHICSRLPQTFVSSCGHLMWVFRSLL